MLVALATDLALECADLDVDEHGANVVGNPYAWSGYGDMHQKGHPQEFHETRNQLPGV